jgi:hypothetical protein
MYTPDDSFRVEVGNVLRLVSHEPRIEPKLFSY